jgi:hypothetical protein
MQAWSRFYYVMVGFETRLLWTRLDTVSDRAKGGLFQLRDKQPLMNDSAVHDVS